MRALLIQCARVVLTVIYGALKLVTHVDHTKVVFLGRRMDQTPPDFELLIQELQRQRPEVTVIVRSMLVTGKRRELPKFFLLVLESLYHLATSKVSVLDSYWPAVSMLRHRKTLTVYQMWHSLGKMKQTGRQSLDREQGRSSRISRLMRMHLGYDYIVAGAPIWNPQYRAAFGVTDEKLLNFGLPRSDYLMNHRDEVAGRVYDAYPELKSKPTVVYVPTFRRGQRPTGAVQLANALDLDQFNLVVKAHGSDDLILPAQPHFTCEEFSGTDMLTIADFVVTDYSSIALEAALIDANIYFFTYDAEHYGRTNGTNLDLSTEMPHCVFDDVASLAHALTQPYPHGELQHFKGTYLPANLGHATTDLANHIFTVGQLCTQ